MIERKAVVLDLDGTLLTRGKTVSSRTVATILECVRIGHLVMVGTARPLRTVLQLFPPKLHSCHLILCNGAWIVKDKNVLYRNEIQPDVVLSVAERLQNNGFQPAIEANDHLYTDPNQARDLAWECLPLSEYPGIAACKVLAHSRKGFDADRIKAIIPSELNHIFTDDGTILQISSRTCCKAAACRIVFDLEHIDLSNTYAFGDDTNDISLFQSVGMGIAMQDATEELKAVARAVTNSNDEDGVAIGIMKYVLQKEI